MRRVFWSEDALAEFCALLQYIAADDPAAATRVAERIEAAVGGLAQMQRWAMIMLSSCLIKWVGTLSFS